MVCKETIIHLNILIQVGETSATMLTTVRGSIIENKIRRSSVRKEEIVVSHLGRCVFFRLRRLHRLQVPLYTGVFRHVRRLSSVYVRACVNRMLVRQQCKLSDSSITSGIGAFTSSLPRMYRPYTDVYIPVHLDVQLVVHSSRDQVQLLDPIL